MTKTKPWFWGGVVYQIYVRSFYDTNNDGIGDLKGVIGKLDYLADTLGVSAIWLCPFYKSPMVDFGYDVSDYESVDPIFGDLNDFKELLKQAHSKGLKVIIDLIANHTSDRHQWFIESSSSKNSPKRNWYVWHNAKHGKPPNDWSSVFGGSAWEFDSHTNQFYLHSFSKHQPDLNWDNPEVKDAIQNVMKFWLNIGVDGFRADAVYYLSKDRWFRNDPLNLSFNNKNNEEYDALIHSHSRFGSHLFEHLRDMTVVLESYSDTFMVIEASPDEVIPGKNQDIPEYLNLYKHVAPKLCAPFNFELIHLPWDAKFYKSFIDNLQAKLDPDYLPIYTFGNHDNPRLASRISEKATPTAAMLLLSLPGLPFIYYGEEIGMKDVQIPKSEQKDPSRLGGYGRDLARTPLQWNKSSNGGFSLHDPWLPIDKDYQKNNIENQLAIPNSLLNLYRALVKLRSQSEALRYGNYLPLEINDSSVFGFTRQTKTEKVAIILNFSNNSHAVESTGLKGKVILSTYLDKNNLAYEDLSELGPNEGMVIDFS